MSIGYRPGRAEDGSAVTAVWAEALNRLNARHGFGDHPVSGTPANPFFAFASTHEPDGFWVAEEDGRVAGFSTSLVYGSFWFLCYLFILPDYQSRGVGRQLIEKSLATARAPTITARGLVTFAYNPASISLYLRYGMYPREPLYSVAGPPAAVAAHLRREATGLAPEKAAPGADALLRLGQVDERVLGFPRDTLHRYLLAAPGASCYFFRERGAVKGYAYLWGNGRVGPLAVHEPTDLGSVMRTALSMAAAEPGVHQVSALVPGSSEQAMAVALEAQLRIGTPFLLMSSRPFTGSASYLLHSPGLM